MIDYITAKDITVLTDGYPHLLKLVEKKIKTYMLEGYLHEDRGIIMYTDNAIHKLSQFHFHKVFLGTVGVDEIDGYMTASLRDAKIKKLQKSVGDQLYILADSQKFNHRQLAVFASLNEATLITEQKPPFSVNQLIIANEVNKNV